MHYMPLYSFLSGGRKLQTASKYLPTVSVSLRTFFKLFEQNDSKCLIFGREPYRISHFLRPFTLHKSWVNP